MCLFSVQNLTHKNLSEFAFIGMDHEKDLKEFLIQKYPSFPLSEKVKAKDTINNIPFFSASDSRSWLDTLPVIVLKAFINYFTKQKLGGTQNFNGYEELMNESHTIKERITQFLNLNQYGFKDTAKEMSSDITSATNQSLSDDEEAGKKRMKFTTEEEESLEKKNSVKPELKTKSLLIILSGLPGSGKSTFCEELINTFDKDQSNIIKRLCQDDIGKDACERQCHTHLSEGGKVVIIDRTNINKAQREIWIKLARRYGCKCLAVVFEEDPKTCISRAAKREGHGLKSKDVGVVVNKLAKQHQIVTESEGIHTIYFNSKYPSNLTSEIKSVILHELKI